MNAWLVLLAIAALAAFYVLLPVGLAMSTHYRRPLTVRCPLTPTEATIGLGRAGIAEIFGRRALRRITSCSLWPAHSGCREKCRLFE
jgi:hypothetical protein